MSWSFSYNLQLFQTNKLLNYQFPKENREKPPKNSAYKGTRRKMENREKKPKKIHHTNVQGEKREKKPKKTQHTKGERQKGNNDKPKIKLCITKLDKIKLNLY